MSEKTAISWTDATFNPWWGCQKVSPACDNCYAERDAKRWAGGKVLWGVGSERRTFGDDHWDLPGKWAKRPFHECLTCGNRFGVNGGVRKAEFVTCKHCGGDSMKLVRRRVFCASMGDWLDLDAPLDQFVRLLDTIRLTPELDWLLLTKRIGNWEKRMRAARDSIDFHAQRDLWLWITEWYREGNPPKHVWLGITVIDQTEANRDVPKLQDTPAAVRFLSIEPMLGPVLLGPEHDTHPRGGGYLERVEKESASSREGEGDWTYCDYPLEGKRSTKAGQYSVPRIDWVICGGESGPEPRKMEVQWVRSLRNQCATAKVPFHFKQWGEWAPYNRGRIDSAMLATPGSTDDPMQKFGTKLAGRMLDGRTHDEFPVVAS